MDRKAFYDAVRSKIGALTQANVEGFERYLDEGWRRNTALDRLAYIIATVFWETGRTMQPVKEAFYLGTRADAFRRKLRYYPWFGRGDIQLTWEENYRKAGQAIGVDLIKNPDAALDPKNAVKIAFEGMEGGWFTGKSVNDYIDGIDEGDDEDLREFANARRVVNGTDKQIEIGQLALTFENALRVAGYSAAHATAPATPAPAPVVVPAPQTEIAIVAVPPVDAKDGSPLSPLEQMNKPVAGAKANIAAGGVGAAALLLINAAGWMPVGWQTPDAQLALGIIVPWAFGAIANFVASYRARDKRFQTAQPAG